MMPIPTKLDLCIRSKLSAMTALIPCRDKTSKDKDKNDQHNLSTSIILIGTNVPQEDII